ncbi:transposase, IS110 family [Klebsiella pneumoniae]|nr:transposase, IS110 family [Klebsiella pneumoniae]
MQLKLVIDALIALRHTRTKKQVGNALRQSSIPRNELLRAKLYMSALCGKIYNKRMRNIYDEMCLRGKPKMVAIGALMRKLVH